MVHSLILVVTLKLFERKDLASILRLLHVRILRQLPHAIHFIEEEEDHLSLVDVTMIRINLSQWLNHSRRALRDTLPVNAFHHFEECITINHTLIDLLIILLEFEEQLGHFTLDTRP